MTTTETETRPDIGTEPKHEILPPWSVILHNDDHNEMFYVVRSLIKCVPNLGTTRATKIMLEAHNRGKALVTTPILMNACRPIKKLMPEPNNRPKVSRELMAM